MYKIIHSTTSYNLKQGPLHQSKRERIEASVKAKLGVFLMTDLWDKRTPIIIRARSIKWLKSPKHPIMTCLAEVEIELEEE